MTKLNSLKSSLKPVTESQLETTSGGYTRYGCCANGGLNRFQLLGQETCNGSVCSVLK